MSWVVLHTERGKERIEAGFSTEDQARRFARSLPECAEPWVCPESGLSESARAALTPNPTGGSL